MRAPTRLRTERRRLVVGATLGCAASGLALPGWPATDLVGVWSGFLDADDPPALLTLRVTSPTTAELVVVGMGALPLRDVRALDGQLSFSTDQPPLRYEGRLAAGGDLAGALQRGDGRLTLNFVRGDLYTEQPMPPLPPGPLNAERLRAVRRAAACPAMGVAWQRDGRAVQVLTDGQRSIRCDVPVQPGDRWHLGSVTKGMTATLAARFVDAGKLSWTTPLAELIGAQVPDMHAGCRDLTLLHLLSHHGGLARDVPQSRYAHLPDAQQRLAYAQAALTQAPLGPPGASMVYSNVDYVVAGLVLETVGRAPWEELIDTHLMRPLGIRNVGFGPPGVADPPDQPQGHRMGARGLEPVRSDVAFALGPAGRVHMLLADLTRYLHAHLTQPPDFLKPLTWAALHTPPFGSSYALGWDVAPDGVLSHGGTNGWWKSEVRIDPRRRLVCAAVTNVLNVNGQQALLQLEDAASLS